MAKNFPINFTDPDSGSFNVGSFVSNGPNFPTTLQLNSTAVSANTSLLLYGKGHPTYGERIQENIVHLLENFAGTTEPSNPISGQQWFVRLFYIQTSLGYWSWNQATSLWVAVTPIIQGTPPTIVDGGFWVDSASSNQLYLGIDDGSHPLAPTWLPREIEDLTGEAITDPNLANFIPQAKLRVYDGTEWKNSGNVYTSVIQPQNPSEGDMWFDVTQLQLKVRYNNLWQESGGQYVNITGDTMTGVLQFGDPTASLFLWESGGNITTAPDIRMSTSGLVSSADDFFIHVDDNNNSTGIFEVAKGTQARTGSQTTLFQVLNDGQIRAGVASYETLAIQNNNNLVNLKYVDDQNNIQDLAISATNSTVGTLQSNITANALAILNKVDLAGDTMTGSLTLNADPVNVLHAATKQYVDTEIATALLGGGTDGVIIGSAFNSSTRELELFTSLPTTISTSLVHIHPANEITIETPFGHVFEDVVGPGPNYNLQTATDEIMQDLYQRTRYMEAASNREVIVISGATTNIGFADMEYQAGRNQIDVFVNGIKQYASERAHQSIYTNSTLVLTESSATGIVSDATNYDLDIAIDGVTQTVTSPGSSLQSIQDIVDEINTQTTGIVADWDYVTRSIRVYSNSQGTGSSIAITDGIVNGLLAALAAITPTTELPIYQLGNVSPAAAGAVTAISQDLSYEETTSGFVSEQFGQRSSFISFNVALVIADVVEIIIRPTVFDL